MKTSPRPAVWKPLLVALALSTALCGCAWSVGGKEEGHTTVNQPTEGQQLVDLKAALDKGAITQQEYDAAKKRVLEH